MTKAHAVYKEGYMDSASCGSRRSLVLRWRETLVGLRHSVMITVMISRRTPTHFRERWEDDGDSGELEVFFGDNPLSPTPIPNRRHTATTQ